MSRQSQKVARNKWPENPDYDLKITPFPNRVIVKFAGEIIADSRNVTVLREQGHAPVYYFPRDDISQIFLRRTDHRSHCPYKGHCSYFSIIVGDRVAENAVWSYEDPYPEMRGITGLAAFYSNRVDSITVE